MWPFGESREQKLREALRAEADKRQAIVEAAVKAHPFRVSENPDGTWRASRSRLSRTFLFHVGNICDVAWEDLDGCERLPCEADANAAVRRYIKGARSYLNSEGNPTDD